MRMTKLQVTVQRPFSDKTMSFSQNIIFFKQLINYFILLQAFLGKACDSTHMHWYMPPEILGVLFLACLLYHQFIFISKCRQFTK